MSGYVSAKLLPSAEEGSIRNRGAETLKTEEAETRKTIASGAGYFRTSPPVAAIFFFTMERPSMVGRLLRVVRIYDGTRYGH
jgi:hypothetical protein